MLVELVRLHLALHDQILEDNFHCFAELCASEEIWPIFKCSLILNICRLIPEQMTLMNWLFLVDQI